MFNECNMLNFSTYRPLVFSFCYEHFYFFIIDEITLVSISPVCLKIMKLY